MRITGKPKLNINRNTEATKLKITKARVERTFNLGNYESDKIAFEAELSEGEKPLEVTADLEMLCHQHMQNMKAHAGNGTAETTSTPKTNTPSQTAPAPTPASNSQPRNPEWIEMQSTTKGPWSRSKDLANPAIQEIINQLNSHHGFYEDDIYKYWLMKDQYDETKITGVGRRQK